MTWAQAHQAQLKAQAPIGPITRGMLRRVKKWVNLKISWSQSHPIVIQMGEGRH